MKIAMRFALVFAFGASIVLLIAAACQPAPDPSTVTQEIPSGRAPNASVTGSVTYNERLDLSPDATLVVELRDTSYADASAELIARHTISDPGQVPIKFKVEYNRDDVEDRNTYSISARIIEADGRLAFTNDTAYDVITDGNPDSVDILLVLVEPPPDLIPADGSDWQAWVEVPVQVISANLVPNEPEQFLRVAYYQSIMEGCSRSGNQNLEIDGNNIRVQVTLMQPPPTEWAIPCQEQVVELDTVELIEGPLKPGQTYQVIVNDLATTTFTIPAPSLGYTFITESPVQHLELDVLESDPPQYHPRVVSGMPTGSSCSQFNGYEITRRESNTIEVAITHHAVSDPSARCTKDYPTVETVVPLGSNFESGVEYTVRINSDTEETFIAQ